MIRDRSFWMGLFGVLVGCLLTEIVRTAPVDDVRADTPSTPAASIQSDGTSQNASHAQARTASDRYIPFQAYLTDSEGRPVADTRYSIEFKLYESAEGGEAIWRETHNAVPVAKGMVNVLLGSKNTDNFGDLTFDEVKYVGICVDCTPDTGVELVPRQQIIPAIHARDSDRAGQLVIPGTLDPVVTVDSEGNVGIGTILPTQKLHIVDNVNYLVGRTEARVANTNREGSAFVTLEQAREEGRGLLSLAYFGGEYPGHSLSGLPQSNLAVLGVGGPTPSAFEIQAGGGDAPIVFAAGPGPEPNERMRITPSGNVGIGTTNPRSKLHIQEGSITMGTTVANVPADGSFHPIDVQYDYTAAIYTVNVRWTQAAQYFHVYQVLYAAGYNGASVDVLGDADARDDTPVWNISAEFAADGSGSGGPFRLLIKPDRDAHVYFSKITVR